VSVTLILGILVAGLVVVACYDLTQRKHAILRNFPIVGHFRYWLESVGPELRQYIVTDNNEERPSNYPIIKHAVFPLPSPHPGAANYDSTYAIPCAKVLGGFRNRAKAFRPSSVINISGMSFGSLSGVAVEALNRGGKLATPDRDPRWPVRLEDGCRSARWPRAWRGLRRRSAKHVRP
jgi:hypothetical protein